MNITSVKQVEIVVVLIVAALSRFFLIFFYQEEAGDTSTYELLAKNILRGCGLSFSDPSSNECILTSGGYFPGYPAFIALNWILFGQSNLPILLSQLTIYLITLYWLLIALKKLFKNTKTVFLTGMLLALSPLQCGWFRFIITEPLAIAAATWFFAELINSISEKKLRIYHLSLALSFSVFIRPDTILMSVGVCLVAFYIYNFKESIKQILMIVMLTSIPVSTWMTRNIIIGHGPLSMTSDAGPKASGYQSWLNTWVINEYERADSSFPVWRTEYSKIKLHDSNFIQELELKKVHRLLTELSKHEGKKFPEYIDQQFQEIANDKNMEKNYFLKLELYIKRTFYLIFNPFSSWGLPLEIKNIDKNNIKNAFNKLDIKELHYTLNDQELKIIGKIGGLIYRVIIFVLFVLILMAFIIKTGCQFKSDIDEKICILIFATTLFSLIRISFFIILGALESRYLVELIPWIECCILVWFINSSFKVIIND